MGDQETKNDALMKRAQVIIAILVGVVSLIVALYNLKNNVLSDKSPGSLAITVISEARQPVAHAHVEVLNAQSAIVNTSEADSAGQSAPSGFAPGSYSIRVSHPQFEPQIATVQILSKKTTDVALILRALPSFQQSAAPGSPIKSALEEAGAAWIKKIAQPKSKNISQEAQSETVAN